MKFGKGPKVALYFEINNGAIISSRLSLSDSFNCTGANQDLIDWLTLYSQRKSVPFPLQLSGTLFQQEALKVMQKIPFGQTVSYGELAHLCGRPKAARAIGNACNRNPFPLLIPCHRIIQSDGKIGGFAMNLEIKRRLLEFEASQ